MASKKNLNKRLKLRAACRRAAEILQCQTKDISKLVREALVKLKLGKSDNLVFTVERSFGGQGDGAILKIGDQKSLELQRGTMLLVQRVQFKRILENGGSKDQEMIRVGKFRWTDKIQIVLASIEI